MSQPKRDDFTKRTIDILAKRVNYRCSNPDCRKPTSGPRTDPTKAVNIGVAAHITAASEGGPRYDTSLTSEERASIENGIWLCQNHAKLIDDDPDRYPVDLLREWKEQAEQAALEDIESGLKSEPLVIRTVRSTNPAIWAQELDEWKNIHNQTQILLGALSIPLDLLVAYRVNLEASLLETAGDQWQERCVTNLRAIPPSWDLQWAQSPALDDLYEHISNLDQITRRLRNSKPLQEDFNLVYSQLVDLKGTLWILLTVADKRMMVLIEKLKLHVGA